MKLSFSSYHKATQNCLSQTLSYLLKRKISIFLHSFFSFFNISSLQQLRFVALKSAAIYFLCQNNIYIVHDTTTGLKFLSSLFYVFIKIPIFQGISFSFQPVIDSASSVRDHPFKTSACLWGGGVKNLPNLPTDSTKKLTMVGGQGSKIGENLPTS